MILQIKPFIGLSVLFLSVFFSCGQTKKTEGLEVIPIEAAYLHPTTLKASDYFRKIRYVPLETNDHALVGTRLFTETTLLNFPRAFFNTLFISVFSCIISTVFVLSVAYCMSRLRFKMRKPFMNLAMILGLFPAFMSMVAVYFILKAIGLTEGSMLRISLILIYSAGAGTGFYIAKGFFDTVPKSLTEAAILDGCTQFQVFYKVILPLSKPIVVYTVLTAFLAPWLDFVFVKVIVGPNDKYWTVSLLLYNMLEKEFINGWFTRWAAAAVIVSIPISILFVIMQRFYVDGLTGAVKG